MATRFVKAKVDKYIQLYSEYANHQGPLYSSVSSLKEPIQEQYFISLNLF